MKGDAAQWGAAIASVARRLGSCPALTLSRSLAVPPQRIGSQFLRSSTPPVGLGDQRQGSGAQDCLHIEYGVPQATFHLGPWAKRTQPMSLPPSAELAAQRLRAGGSSPRRGRRQRSAGRDCSGISISARRATALHGDEAPDAARSPRTAVKLVAVDPVLAERLEKAVSQAFRNGWAVCDVGIELALGYSNAAGLGVVPTRVGSGPIDILLPKTSAAAHPRSLSARYGLRSLPLHTDGAHLERPPSLIFLERAPTDAAVEPTLLFPLRSQDLAPGISHAMRNGVFTVGCGPRARLVHALSPSGVVRYDPGCMSAADPLARAVANWFAEAAAASVRHEWSLGHQLLIIDNLRCLHGRSAVGHQPGRALRRLMVHWHDDDAAP